MKKSLLLVVACIALTSCGIGKTTSYNVSLSSVESPADSKVKFGETKVATFEEEGQSKYRYEDDFLDISWSVGEEKFYFTLKNKSDHLMMIPWDYIKYVNENGAYYDIMHDGVEYTDRNAPQPASLVPKNASVSDTLLPKYNVFYTSLTGWTAYPLFKWYSSQEKANNSPILGKTVRIIFPVIIQGDQYEYTFEFSIDNITVK